MSLSLGEKLRQAREERGISISEVAEQTRISSHYLESIENDDYKSLPGGIFNKGFVKSYAKFIGFDEQEALQDYAKLAAESEIEADHPLKVYKPEVLTDDRSSSSMIPTLLFAGVILALMTGGILFVVNYVQNQPSTPNTATNTTGTATNTNSNTTSTGNTQTPVGNAPAMTNLKVEFRATADPISLTSVSDGKSASTTVVPGNTVVFEPKESLKLSYAKSLAPSAQLAINGKTIALPETPSNPRRNAIEFEITKDNLSKIWEAGRITFDVPAAVDANTTGVVLDTNTAVTPTPLATRPPATPMPRPTATATQPVKTPQPSSNTGGAASNTPPRPSPN